MRSHYLWFNAPISFTGGLHFYVHEKGPSLMRVDTNFRNRPEIGWYEGPLAAGTFQHVLSTQQKSKLEDIPAGTVLQTDEQSFSFAETQDAGKTYQIKGVAGRQLTPALEQLVDLYLKEALTLVPHPKKVLRGERAGGPAQVRRGEALRFEVKLSNVGKEPLSLQNPLREDASGWIGLRLHVRADKPEAQLKESDSVHVDLTPELVQPVPADSKRKVDGRLTLAPGESLRFAVKKRLKLSAGAYVAALTYSTTERPGTPMALEGSLTVDLGSFQALADGAAAQP